MKRPRSQEPASTSVDLLALREPDGRAGLADTRVGLTDEGGG